MELPDHQSESITTPTVTTAPGAVPPSSFFIVGIGASAGGLEALETFFDHMSPHSGLAFVVIQHLSPDFKSLMDELLARHTSIPIFRVEDGMEVRPNAIYLIPPKKEMIISGGRLLLSDKAPGQSLSLPIDTFFRSLARDVGSNAVAVVLSGTGSDGSRGIRDVNEAGGFVLAQNEETAKFDGMPRAAADTGAVHCVLAPEAIPAAILAFVEHRLRGGEGQPMVSPGDDGMAAIFRILRDQYGIDFSHYKPSTVTRRIDRRLQLNQSVGLDDYIARLRHDPAELNSLYRDLLIGVTKFFRDQEAFARLESDVIPQLVAKAAVQDELRIWVAGCATGEEPYSLAILFHERLTALGRPLNLKVFATDVHRASLDVASTGIYPEANLSEVSSARLDRYFQRQGALFQVSPELRKLIVFAPHNIIKDAPFTKLDLISCRNLLIYLQPAAQRKVISLFHFGLRPGGVLVLGPSESPGEMNDEFEVIDPHWKVYRKRRNLGLPPDMRMPLASGVAEFRRASAVHTPAGGMIDSQLMRAYDALLSEFVPPSFLVNDRRQILHVFGGAGKYLAVRDGRPTADILDLVDRELKLALAGAVQRAAKDGEPVVYTGIRVPDGDGESQVRLSVRPLPSRSGETGMMLISIEPMVVTARPVEAGLPIDLDEQSRERLVALEAELRYTKENLQATVEEMETSNEELQATNEELVASNEELQSTNEELHSVNEELYSVNAEYQRKIDELTEMTDDMENLFRATDVGTIFLDKDLRIRKFTPKIAELFEILPQDVGRRVDTFSHHLAHKDLATDLRSVLETGARVEKQVQDNRGHWLLLRILPYQARDTTEGIVLTVVDINSLKETENRLRLMSKVFMDAADAIIIEDLGGRIVGLNAEAERIYGYAREELLGQPSEVLLPPEQLRLAQDLRQRCRNAEPLRNVEMSRRTKSGTLLPSLLTFSLLTDELQFPVAIASIAKDISDQKRAEKEAYRYALELEQANRVLTENIDQRRRAEDEAFEAVRRRDQFLAMLSHELRNPLGAILNAVQLLGRAAAETTEADEARRVIGRQAEQMARLLADLLDVSRVTQGKIEIRREVVDLSGLVGSVLEVARPMIEARQQELVVNVDPGAIPVRGDAARLQQIQINLMANASKYTPCGGRICLSLGRSGSDAVIRIEDDGEGIPPEMIDRIFDIFVQSKSTIDRSEGGMGVGLTLVRSLVHLHGGTVQAESAGPGCGSTFTVRLPLVEAARGTPEPEPDAPAGGARILIVEDNADSRKMLQALLELEGYRVVSAGDGLTALEIIGQQAFDLALVDIGLPGIDGYELARRVRQMGVSLRLVALTGYGRPSDREAALSAGFDDHAAKPLAHADLMRVLASIRPRQ